MIRISISAVLATALTAGMLFGSGLGYAPVRPTIPETEKQALIDLYNATDGTYWTEDTGWLTDPDPCKWYGVSCGSHTYPSYHVVWLKLPNNNLNGTIPSSITNLVELDELLLNDNHLTGPLPTDLDKFEYLVNLCLQNNQLSGSIPASIGSIGLTDDTNGGLRIFLHINQLTGPIPKELGNLPRLRYLNLGLNQLTGEVPDELGGLDTLWELDLSFNRLEGAIPASFSGLSQLRKFKVGDNQLSGGVPAWLGNLHELRELELQHNLLEGPVPAELSGPPYLETLWLAYNRLSGELPGELGVLANLKMFWLTSNNLSGPIPETLTNLTPSAFWYDKTNLCEPCTEEYQSWLQTILSLKRTGACPPTMSLSNNQVGPGGYIVVTGRCWPSEMLLSVYMNDALVGNITSDFYGSFSFELWVAENWTDFGWYWFSIKKAQTSLAEDRKSPSGCGRSADGTVEATAGFRVAADAPAWPSQGGSTVLDVPVGIAYTVALYLPMERAQPRPLTIGLGDPVVPDNLSLMEGGDYDTLAVTAGSPAVAARRTGNGTALPATDGNTVSDYYMQFDALNALLLAGVPTAQLYIDVEYLDQGTDTFNIQYDALTGGPFGDGRFKDSVEVITKTNTGTWKTARFAIEDAYFADRDHDGDFRICDLWDGYEVIRQVTVILVY